jgi:hypothetical protein
MTDEVHVHDVSKLRGRLKAVGGAMSDDWNNIVANQTVQALWLENSSPEDRKKKQRIRRCVDRNCAAR